MFVLTQFGLPRPMTVNVESFINQSNSEEHRGIHIFNCPKCVTDFGNFLMFVMAFSVFIILPMIEIVTGIVYQNECSIKQNIPIYLIIAGIISLIILIFVIFEWMFVWPSTNYLKLEQIKSFICVAGTTRQSLLVIEIVFLLFGLIWFIVGNVWIFGIRYNVQYNDPIGHLNTYCDRIVYLCGFWSIMVKYIFLFVVCCRVNCFLSNSIRKTIDEAQMNVNISVP